MVSETDVRPDRQNMSLVKTFDQFDTIRTPHDRRGTCQLAPTTEKRMYLAIADDHPRKPKGSKSPPKGNFYVAPNISKRSMVCLLYTSDAADDTPC
eukprot:329901-Pyramimonas_sp.AAC.2